MVFLMKVAEFLLLKEQGGMAIFLLDDFLTDFDDDIVRRCLKVLVDLKTQVFISTPLKKADFFASLAESDVQQIELFNEGLG